MGPAWNRGRLPQKGEAKLQQFLAEEFGEKPAMTEVLEPKEAARVQQCSEAQQQLLGKKRKGTRPGARARSRARVQNDELGKIICKQLEAFV